MKPQGPNHFRRFYEAVTAALKRVLSVFLVLTLICAVLGSQVAVNYDINDYLPSDSPSTVAPDVMTEEFDGGIPNVRVMIQNVSIPESLDYKQQLKEIEGVTEVMRLDDSIPVTAPLETADKETVESYYKDGAALYSVTLEEKHILDGVEAIRNTIGKTKSETEFALTGSAVSTAAGAILQLAVSPDYSVFLLHRFEESRRTGADVRGAKVDALCKSTGSILSSGLTTVIGFAALCLMRFKIGPDPGMVPAKGAAWSLICVYKLLDRTRRHSFVP